jgi:PBSX family phage terminase large subunit
MAIDVYSSYHPLPWQIEMHSTHWKHACFAGGKGGGKTRAGIEELVSSALEFPGTRWLIGRKTRPSLMDTTYKEFMQSVPDELIKESKLNPTDVTLVNGSSFIFRPLDEIKKFDSLEIAGFLFDEADENEKKFYDVMKSRVRQVLTIAGRKVYPRYRTILILNPCEEDHWIPQLFLHHLPDDSKLFQSSTMDNTENLPPDYLEELKKIYTPEMQQRMIHGMFGKVHKGRPVFPQFARGQFIRGVEYNPEFPIWRGWDFGYNHPSCVWLQFINGQARVLAEKLGKEIYLDDFVKGRGLGREEGVLHYQKELFGEKVNYKDFCDPHGSDESDKGKTSVDILNEFGIYPLHRRTRIQEGIKAIKGLMDTKEVESGEANFLIHPRCKNLIEGLRGGYHREDGAEDPAKDGYYDHLMDAMRYVLVHLVRRTKFNSMQSVIQAQNVYVHPITGRRIEY